MTPKNDGSIQSPGESNKTLSSDYERVSNEENLDTREISKDIEEGDEDYDDEELSEDDFEIDGDDDDDDEEEII